MTQNPVETAHKWAPAVRNILLISLAVVASVTGSSAAVPQLVADGTRDVEDAASNALTKTAKQMNEQAAEIDALKAKLAEVIDADKREAAALRAELRDMLITVEALRIVAERSRGLP